MPVVVLHGCSGTWSFSFASLEEFYDREQSISALAVETALQRSSVQSKMTNKRDPTVKRLKQRGSADPLSISVIDGWNTSAGLHIALWTELTITWDVKQEFLIVLSSPGRPFWVCVESECRHFCFNGHMAGVAHLSRFS